MKIRILAPEVRQLDNEIKISIHDWYPGQPMPVFTLTKEKAEELATKIDHVLQDMRSDGYDDPDCYEEDHYDE